MIYITSLFSTEYWPEGITEIPTVIGGHMIQITCHAASELKCKGRTRKTLEPSTNALES